MADSLPDTWLQFARDVVAQAAHQRDPRLVPEPPDAPPHSGAFVTLHSGGRLRGCMGTLSDALTLSEAVRHAATCAALDDPRFPALRPDELSDLHIELSVLSPPVPMSSIADLELGRHGIIVRRGGCRGLFLPQVATEHHMSKEEFLSRCCSEKAGLPPEAWRDPATEVLLFTAQILTEPGREH